MALAGVDAGADRAPRRGLARGGGGARRRGDRAARRGRRDRHHRDRRARAAAARPSRSGRSACRSPSAAARGSTAPSSCPATARWCASARPPSRCTCCGGCSMARRRLSGSSSRSTCPRRRGRRSRPSATPRRTRRSGGPCADEALHVTLVFLGHRPAGRVGRASRRSCASARVRPPTSRSAPALLLPPRRARVLCAEVEDRAGALGGAAGARRRPALAAAGLHEPERRPFRPHATVARLRAGARAPRSARLGEPGAGRVRGRGGHALPLAPVARRARATSRSSGSRSADRPARRCAAHAAGVSSRARWPGSARVSPSAPSPPLAAVLALPARLVGGDAGAPAASRPAPSARRCASRWTARARSPGTRRR